MLKIAVIGAGTMLGRALVETLEVCECSVLPLSCGVMTREEEFGDLVIFEPQPSLLEGIDVIILTEPLIIPGLLACFQGRILDLCVEPDLSMELIPVSGSWPQGVCALRARSALEQVLATVPNLVKFVGDISGTHLQSVAYLGDRGITGLMEQTLAVLNGEDPKLDKLSYRSAFEVTPCVPRGSVIQVRVPVFHGDLLVLHLRSVVGQRLSKSDEMRQDIEWKDKPPTSREVAISPNLLVHLAIANEGQTAVMTLGFDPILWGALRPVKCLLGL